MTKYLSLTKSILLAILTSSCAINLVLACDCNLVGSYDNICDAKTGQCHCKPSFKGKNCDQCKQNGLVFPKCTGDAKCQCNLDGTRYDAKKKGPCVKEVRWPIE